MICHPVSIKTPDSLSNSFSDHLASQGSQLKAQCLSISANMGKMKGMTAIRAELFRAEAGIIEIAVSKEKDGHHEM